LVNKFEFAKLGGAFILHSGCNWSSRQVFEAKQKEIVLYCLQLRQTIAQTPEIILHAVYTDAFGHCSTNFIG